ncbi:MAG: TolC family protein [Desulfuromonadaceae bacterium]|nr:TolC family protein [Desulfuromonadaceae bacterium]
MLRVEPWRVDGRFSFFILLTWLVFSSVPATAGTVSLDASLAKALAHSWDIRIARKRIDISRYALWEMRSLYFPTLTARFDNQYVEDLTSNGNNVVTIGDQTVPIDGSTYQHGFGVGLSFLLFDFGVREIKVGTAKKDARIADFKFDQALVDTKVKVLEAFGRCLEMSRRWKTMQAIVDHRRELFELTGRLRVSGAVGQVDVHDAALVLAEAVTEQKMARRRLEEALLTLSFFTGEDYNAETADFAPLPDLSEPEAPPRPERLGEIRALNEEISKKLEEKRILQGSMLPAIHVAGSYRALGSDEDSFSNSLENLESRDFSVALMARWEIFSGFRDVARILKLTAETERLKLEKKRRLSDRWREMQSAYRNYLLSQSNETAIRARESVLGRRTESDQRLADQRITDRMTLLTREIEVMEQQLAVAMERMEGRLAGLRLKFWRKGES